MEMPSWYTKSLRWMYRGGRPNRLAAVMNRAGVKASNLGLGPKRSVTLEVRGRRSGRMTSNPLVVADLNGQRYLVSMLGNRADWVANVRAADSRAVLRHGKRERIAVSEVPVAERAPILKRYLDQAPGARPHIPVDRRAPLEAFERIAPDYPVFRIEKRT